MRGCLLALAASAAGAMGQVEFPVSFDESLGALSALERAALESHFVEAGRAWSRLLDISGPRSIEILIRVDNGAPRFTGRSETSAFVGVIEGRNTFEQGMAYELRTGVDPNGAIADVIITVNLGYLRNELWLDPDPGYRTAPVPGTRTDAMSVALHEIGHAIAYNGWADGWGFPPAGYWSPWDRWMAPGVPGVSAALFTGPESVASWGGAPDLTIGNITHWGNGLPAPDTGMARDGGVTWRNGVPLPACACHGPASADAPAWGDRGGTLLDELMNGVVFYRGRRYELSALDAAVLEDVGLTLRRACAADLAEPFGVLDLSDLVAFVAAFIEEDDLADFAEPSGVFDLGDLVAFVVAFSAGCP